MIEINNLTTNPVEEEFLKRIAKKVLERESSSAKATEDKESKKNLSIALVSSARIKELNKKYRKKNKTTDVLSFGENTKYKMQRLGEIVICLSEVKKNAKRFRSTFKKELARVLIHGILHLLGYEHEKSKKDAKIMEEKENYYLKKIAKLCPVGNRRDFRE